jgi:multidrug resistance protein MdtO
VLQQGVALFDLTDAGKPYEDVVRASDVLRDQVGKGVAGIRQMKDSVNYEFGADREEHVRQSEILLRATITAAALFWNQLAALHSENYQNFVANPELQNMRRKIATHLQDMAAAAQDATPFVIVPRDELASADLRANQRCGEYVTNIVARYDELQAFVSTLPLGAGTTRTLKKERNAASPG